MSKIDFPVVGIGASAGGLNVLQDFFDHLDADSEMAFVVITHLAPEKTSSMDELLASHTSMEVRQVQEQTEIQPNHIYVIPPNKQLYIEGNQLVLGEKQKDTQAVIDVFFRSMAKECEKNAIGIILSGTGSDGTLGVKAVKEYGGVTMVQDPNEAAYDGMPNSAIETDLVDFVLPVKKLAEKVIDHKKILNTINVPLQEEELTEEEISALQEIFGLLASEKGHDFKHYKRSSVLRRLQRRMYITKNKSISSYREYLDENPKEITELFKDLLISVTNFFRDPEAFEIIEKKVIPEIFKNKNPDDPIRIWITGCATGEEVYSLAILLHEYASSQLEYMPKIKIFGTDISNEALRIARRGVYPEAIATDVSKKRLQQYFHKENSGYRVIQEIREKVLISNHDILSDPPFLNQDLISCRNLLIYFNHDLQNEVLKILHYSLNKEGFLFLGMADSTIPAKDFFAPVDKSNGVYKAREMPTSQKNIPHFPLSPNILRSRSINRRRGNRKSEFTFDKLHYSLLADQYAPASVIIDDNNQVMHSSKGIDQYLHYGEGEPTRDLLKMVSTQIQRSLQNIIFQYNQLDKPNPISKKIRIQQGEELQSIKLEIQPIRTSQFPSGFRQVTFEKVEETTRKTNKNEQEENKTSEEPEVIEQLETELKQTKEQLQQSIEEYETSNEELMASNEELQSMNEELQTTTEELETSKEELQSVNEELRTVNQELESKIDELKKANNDLKNLMEATEIGIIFVDQKFNIKLYTSNAADLFNIIDSDVGRPISDVTHNLLYDNLIDDATRVLSEYQSITKQVTTRDEDWFIMHLKPYKTTEYDIEGVIITFVDITDLKEAEKELTQRAENDEALAMLGTFILECSETKPIMDKAVTMLSDELNIDHTALLKTNHEDDTLLLSSGMGWPETEETFTTELIPNSAIASTLENNTPLVFNDYKNDDRFTCSDWLLDIGIRSGINVVVKSQKRVYGILGVYTVEQRSFTKHEINFIQNTANMVGEAIERIGTEKELKEAYEALEQKVEAEKELQQEILDVEKKERWRLGQYLHDGTAQDLLGINMLFNIIEPKLETLDENTRTELKKIKRLIVQSEKNIRELSHFVLPIDKDDKVSDAFQKLCKQVRDLYNIECHFDSENIADKIKEHTTASSLYYIAQEAIRNAVNHGQADEIDVILSTGDGFLYLTIEDNGIGFDELNEDDGRGINIMKHRADLLEGSLEINKKDNENGTVLTCTIPIEKIDEK